MAEGGVMRDTVPVKLPGSAKDEAPMRMCDKHGQMAPQGGGVQITPTKWSCATCWKLRLRGMSRG
jgi:hypothetical protein